MKQITFLLNKILLMRHKVSSFVLYFPFLNWVKNNKNFVKLKKMKHQVKIRWLTKFIDKESLVLCVNFFKILELFLFFKHRRFDRCLVGFRYFLTYRVNLILSLFIMIYSIIYSWVFISRYSAACSWRNNIGKSKI